MPCDTAGWNRGYFDRKSVWRIAYGTSVKTMTSFSLLLLLAIGHKLFIQAICHKLYALFLLCIELMNIFQVTAVSRRRGLVMFL